MIMHSGRVMGGGGVETTEWRYPRTIPECPPLTKCESRPEGVSGALSTVVIYMHIGVGYVHGVWSGGWGGGGGGDRVGMGRGWSSSKRMWRRDMPGEAEGGSECCMCDNEG